ncbi:MAG: S-methyl-5-thioribose-1-phosphate isomerase, partial [Sulfobacillus benefaciens]
AQRLDALSPEFQNRLQDAAQRISQARPTAVNLSWAITQALERIRGMDPMETVSTLQTLADRLKTEDVENNMAMGRAGRTLFAGPVTILTHCNAGSLATGGYGTALGVIRALHENTWIRHVWVDETRPLLQGARLTAWELMHEGIPATLLTDSMAASVMARGAVDAIIVGADRIAHNGDTANKIGTYGLAVLAHYHQVPFYVAAPVSTIDRATPDGPHIPIEQRAADEVRRIGNVSVAPADITVYNPAFDVTPAALITAIITERGIVHTPTAAAIDALFARPSQGAD